MYKDGVQDGQVCVGPKHSDRVGNMAPPPSTILSGMGPATGRNLFFIGHEKRYVGPALGAKSFGIGHEKRYIGPAAGGRFFGIGQEKRYIGPAAGGKFFGVGYEKRYIPKETLFLACRRRKIVL